MSTLSPRPARRSSAEAITITHDDLKQLVAARVAELLTPERVEEMAEEHIGDRVGQLTLEQAARHLKCANVRQLRDFCREHSIPIEHFGAKKQFILMSEIRAAQERHKLRMGGGPTIARIPPAPAHKRPAA